MEGPKRAFLVVSSTSGLLHGSFNNALSGLPPLPPNVGDVAYLVGVAVAPTWKFCGHDDVTADRDVQIMRNATLKSTPAK